MGRRAPALVVALVVFAALTVAQSRRPDGVSKATQLLASIADVEAGRATTPLIGERAADGRYPVTFLAKREGGLTPRIVSDVTGWGERPDGTFDVDAGTMARVANSDWYFLETAVVAGARIEYLIARGVSEYGPDPHNPRRTALRGVSPASEFVAPGYVPPPEFEDRPVSSPGRVEEATVESRALGAPCAVAVYTPPGHRKNGDYPAVIFHGGIHVARAGVAQRVLDWLIERRLIQPVVAAFAESWEKDNGQASAARLRTFLSDELPAWLASRDGATADASRRAILGLSYGAKDALDAAVRTRAFGRVGLLIPGRRMTPADIKAFASASARGPRMRIAILAGLYDGPNLGTARRARQALAAAGHSVNFIEVPEGHNQGTWRNHLRDVLLALLGRD